MWKQLPLTLLTTAYLVSSQELKVFFSEEEVQTTGSEDDENSRILTVRLDKDSLQPGVMERLSKTSNIIFADFPGLPEFVNAKEYEDILNSLYNDKEDQDNSQLNKDNVNDSNNSMDAKEKEDDRNIEIIEEEPKRKNKEDYAKDTLKDGYKDEHGDEVNKEKDNDDLKNNEQHHDNKDDKYKEDEKEHKEKMKDHDDENKEQKESKEDYDNGEEEYDKKNKTYPDSKDKKEKVDQEEESNHEDQEGNEDNKEKKKKNVVTSYTSSCKSNSTEAGSFFKEKQNVSSTLSGFSTKTNSGKQTSKTAYARNQNATIFNATNFTSIIVEEENSSFNLSPVAMPLALLVATITFMFTF